MSWWLEKLAKNLTTGINSENSVNNSKNNITSSNESEEEILANNSSIFTQNYELNGCYKCTLCTSGVGLGSYKCDVIFMEKKLIVLHLVSRNNLNISRILAPIAATAFATSFKGDNSKVSKGEWIVLPFDLITGVELQNQGKEVRITTRSGISYFLGENEECILKVCEIYNERRDSLKYLENKENVKNSNSRSFTIHNADIPISSRENIGKESFSDFAPLAHIFPGCIVSIKATELAEILTDDLFYGKYILDPKETFELEISKWEGQSNIVSNDKSEFWLKRGASREIQYRRKISTGVLDIWVSFTEKHQILFPTDRSFMHILICVIFTIFEKEVGIKILIRLVEIQENKTQFDLECELENTSSLPYLVRYQLESSTINNIKSTVQNYIQGIKDHLSGICSGNMDSTPEFCSNTAICNLNHPESKIGLFNQTTAKCDESIICCFQPFHQVLRSLFQF
ncbi:hypothetical protein CmeUKMEL1_03180 [Cryptosporidium meleagridis]|uniref:Uncharacterized protein n=1 Tax=Cryptosporidium meleagridis TaxID=93969 RepID=A0A2P4YXR3_9CRYT|nr:hypothetical protein CmeUKMEL1_03180 [Cryptosporidium meleagridis]